MTNLLLNIPPSKHMPLLFEHYDVDTLHREDVETFIHQVFSDSYGANITSFLPDLFALRSSKGSIMAAVGMRVAGVEPLFLETYLDKPIEQVIYDVTPSSAQHPNRKDIIELGNLTAVHPGSARLIIIAMTTLLYHAGFKWVSFTAVPTLVNSFKKLGLDPVLLGHADKEMLAHDAKAEWGGYYDHQPMVFAGRIADGYKALENSNLYSDILVSANQWAKTAMRPSRNYLFNQSCRSIATANS
jgi:hypothetical protein